jgi:hypothetical protein
VGALLGGFGVSVESNVCAVLTVLTPGVMVVTDLVRVPGVVVVPYVVGKLQV